MRTELTPDQIDSYRTNGFLLIDGFLDPDELQQWRATTEEAVAQRLAEASDEGPARLTNQQDPNSYYAQVFTQCLKLADTHDGMRSLMHDPRIGEMIATLAGVDGIRIWHDQALFKPPFGNPTAWHLDNPYWSFSSHDALSLWVALDDATVANGCMWYLPGTHKEARFETVGIGMSQSDLFQVYPEWREITPVSCEAKAGSAVVHNGLTAHGAGANMTNRARRAMTCAYMPDGAAFNGTQNVLPHEYFETLAIGDLLNSDAVNPLISRKS